MPPTELPISDFDRPELVYAQKEEIEKAYLRKSEENFSIFARGLIIDSQFGPQLFNSCIAGFQRHTFDELQPSLESLRDGKQPKCQRWWIERTKKASKDADLAIIVLWLVAFPTKPFYGQIAAADREQAGIVKDRISNLLHLNPWLNDHVTLVQNKVKSKKLKANGDPMCVFDILATDTAGSHGGTPDLLIVNELSHITNWEFVETLMNNADGVAWGMIILATNAGFKNTPAWQWRLNAIKSEDWEIHVLAKPAPWHNKKSLKDAKARNPKGVYLRLWRGIWVSGKGDAFDEELIDACFVMPGPIEREPEWMYVAGLDLGISRDHSGLAIVAVNPDSTDIKVVKFKWWAPPEGGKIDLMEVERYILAMHQRYRLTCMFFDPHQAELMGQRLSRYLACQPVPFSSGKNLDTMANVFLQLINAGRLKCYDDEAGRLRRDFARFNIVERPYGYRLEPTKAILGDEGHADVGTAVAIALPGALDLLEGGYGWLPDDIQLVGYGEKPTDEEIAEMPEEYQDLFSLEEEEEKRATLSQRDDFDVMSEYE